MQRSRELPIQLKEIVSGMIGQMSRREESTSCCSLCKLVLPVQASVPPVLYVQFLFIHRNTRSLFGAQRNNSKGTTISEIFSHWLLCTIVTIVHYQLTSVLPYKCVAYAAKSQLL